MKHFYCAGKCGNATKDKLSDCIGLFGKSCKFHQQAPLQSPSFTCSRKCAIVVFLSSFFRCIYTNWELQVNSDEVRTFFHHSQVTESTKSSFDVGTEIVSLPGFKLVSTFLFPKRLQLWKSTEEKQPKCTDVKR